MSVKYYHLKVKEVVRETPDTVTIHFWHPLSEMIKYEPGQFLTLIPVIDGHKVRRSYSMSSSPHVDVSPAVSVKRVPGGLVSNWLNDHVKEGDFMETMAPMGKFTLTPDDTQTRHVVLIGAGSGITPLMSIAKSVLMVEPESRVTLLYGSRNEDTIIFRAQLESLQQKYGDRFDVHHALSQPQGGWDGISGRLNKTHILRILESTELFDAQTATFYICGPDGLMDEAKRALAILNVPADHVMTESFVSATAAAGDVTDDDDGSLKTQEITVLYEGSEYKFDVAPHQTILEAALDLDIDLPYSCQAGMCTACLAKCTSGKIKLDEEDGLTDSEMKAGYILTCVAHPLTRDVVIEIE